MSISRFRFGNWSVNKLYCQEMTTPSGSYEIMVTPQELAGPNQPGTFALFYGSWSITANETLYLFLNTVFHYLMMKATVHIESITVYIYTAHVDAHLWTTLFREYSAIDESLTSFVDDDVHLGDGTIGNENTTFIINKTLIANHWYLINYDCVAAVGRELKIRAIKIKYKLT